MPADRERIITLSRTPAASAEVYLDAPAAALPNDPMRFNLSEEQGSNLSLRVAAWFELPRRALEAPWLSTAAKMALLDSLNASPIPRDLWVGGPSTLGQPPTWEIFQARSASVRARALQADPLSSHDRPNCGGGVYLGQAGRELAVLLEVRFADGDAAPSGHHESWAVVRGVVGSRSHIDLGAGGRFGCSGVRGAHPVDLPQRMAASG